MKKISKYKILISVFISIILIITSGVFFSVDAAKRIKSTKVSLNTSKVTIAIGDIVDLKAKMTPSNSTDKLKWSTSNKSIATINSYGVVTGIKTGKATITVKTTSKKTAKCTVTVKKYLTESEVLNLIKTKCLSEEKVKELITKNTLSKEEKEKLITDKTLSESTIKSMIESNTLSTSQVNTIIENYMKKNNNTTNNSNWADGTDILLHETQEIPLTLTYVQNSTEKIIINNIKIKKYHYNNIHENIYYPYKYIIKINGTLPYSTMNNKHFYLKLNFHNQYGTSCNSYYLPNDANEFILNEDKTFNITIENLTNVDTSTFTLGSLEYDLYGDDF